MVIDIKEYTTMGKLKQKILFCGLKLVGSGIPEKYSEIVRLSNLNQEDLKDYQKNKLEDMLVYAYENVPYYHETLLKAGVIDDQGKVCWENYGNIPKLTKKIIKNRQDDLKSKDATIKGVYANHSGGSSGTPIEIIQDKNYNEWNVANTLFVKSFGNYYLGDRELRLWGSERDLLEGSESLSLRIRNSIYGRKELNSFKMSLENMEKYVTEWNRYKPQWVEAYTQAIYELAVFIKKRGLKVYTPKGIVTSAGTLYPSMRAEIEEVFKCKVFNRYGSREIGGAACNCKNEDDLHLSVWNQYVEILDDNMNPIEPGKQGKIYVTTLNNHIMPLIRYEIGDIAESVVWDHSCSSYAMPLLKNLEGREMSVVYTRDGKIIPGEFFIHFIGVVYNTGFIDKFQIIQRNYEKIEIKAHIIDKNEFERSKGKIEDVIRLEMSDEVEIVWTMVENIPNMKSGKYLYVYSEVER